MIHLDLHLALPALNIALETSEEAWADWLVSLNEKPITHPRVRYTMTELLDSIKLCRSLQA